LDWVHELNLGPLSFELDAKRVVDNFNSQNCDATKFENISNHCKFLCSNFYENSHVEFVRRQTNEVVYSLTKVTLLSYNFQIWVKVRDYIEHILINEMQ